MPEADFLKLTQITIAEQRKNGAFDYINKVWNQKANMRYLAHGRRDTPFHLYLNEEDRQARPHGPEDPHHAGVPRVLRLDGREPDDQPPPGEVYTALERGVVDGYGWPIHGIFDLNWHEKTKFRVDPGFYNAEVSLIMNLDTYKKLPPKQREYLDRRRSRSRRRTTSGRPTTRTRPSARPKAGIQAIKFDARDQQGLRRQGLRGRLGQRDQGEPASTASR